MSIPFAALLLAGCATVPAGPTTPAQGLAPLPPSIPSDLPRTARPLHYRIDFVPDVASLTFSGMTSIDLELFARSRSLTLHANELAISAARLFRADGTGAAVPLTVTYDTEQQTAELTAPAPLEPGRYRVDMQYTGKIGTQATGLFALDWPDKRTGESVRGLFTQFEAPDARRFAPTFDEPSYKATFDLSATVPANQMAVSNMPLAGEERLPGGLKKVTFRTSPKMSSYLLFFALGDFERLSMRGPDGTDLGIVAPTGSGEQARYALQSMAPLMRYYGDYFGTEYPLPKLDNVTAPGQSQFFSAMENWGAILTFERILLDDPANSSAAARQNIFSVQAHEVAHQWFGNIVTMAWWDDLWLNEGFASWLETKATDHFNPEWHALLGRVAGRETAMGLDAFVTTHPVVQPVRTVSELSQAFDAIAYQKGEAVISMLEAYAGDDVWRNGIRTYIQRHEYQNTVSDDLWRAVEEAGATGLTAIAHDFTRQPGIPLVNVRAECQGGSTALTLTQSEFSRDRKGEVAARPQRWRVPLLIKPAGGTPVRAVLDREASLTLPGCGPVIVNGGQLGYFRTLYSPEMTAALAGGMPQLDPIDQLGLVRDNLALAQAGYQGMAPALDLLAAVPADANPVVAEGAVARWAAAHALLTAETDKTRLAAIARERWLPRLRGLGFVPRAGESAADSNLRAGLIGTLGGMGEETVATEARRRFAALVGDPKALDGPLKTTWLGIAARNATAQDWELLHRLARSTTSTIERQTYYELLGSANDVALAQRALDLALTGEAGTTSAAIIARVAQRHSNLAYDFALANRAQVEAMLDASGRADYIAELAQSATDPGMIDKLEALRRSLPADQARPVERVIGQLRQRFADDPRMRAETAAWLAAR
ncbi:MAG: aminopeptidase [Sphingomonadales bacterium 32-68-7]|nr:MAG: aminopeptidase [Sphingomonadales bacterium 12-68-11]OYX08251.1 MAG: aminopeptidase [Sphingomonadales bacterium 32-68-7]